MPYPPKSERNKELVEKIRSGWSFRRVAKHFNISVSTAHGIYHYWQGKVPIKKPKVLGVQDKFKQVNRILQKVT